MPKLHLIKRLRPFLPVIVGLSLGISMSIVRMPINHEDCVHLSKDHLDRKLKSIENHKDQLELNGKNPNSVFKPMSKDEAERYRKDREFAPPVYDSLEDFEPRIITDPDLKPKIDANAIKNKKKIVRTRYLSTELGIREKLVCSILTSTDSLKTLGYAFNKTFSHHMKKVIFFQGQSPKSNPSAPGITLVLHPKTSPTQILLQTLTHLYNKFKDEYDWYYIGPDSTYAEPTRVNYIVDHISINRRLYLGKPSSFMDEIGQVVYCRADNGFILSRMLLIDVMSRISSCSSDPDMDTIEPDHWLGRCIKRTTRGAVDCASEEEGVAYTSFSIENSRSNFDIDTETSSEFKNAVTVSGVSTAEMMYSLHKRFSQFEIEKAHREITEIQEEIKSLAPKLPEGERELSWPIGINPPFKPTSRWEIIVWDYFTEDYTLTCPGEVPKCALSGIDKIDVQNIVQVALERLNEKYNKQGLVITKKKLASGYRRFDPQRGMEYILDLVLNVLVDGASNPVEINHRVELLRPLSEVEIIPMPYVTESAKVHIVLPLISEERQHFRAFMEKYAKVCLASEENVILIVVFIYYPTDAERIHDNDIYTEQKQLLQQYESHYGKSSEKTKLIPWVSIKTEVPSQIKVMDIIAKKYPTNTLFFYSSIAANMNTNFLNRCRMNSIQGWQAFFPLPFSNFNPDIIYKNGPVPEQIEIKPTNGHFDIYSFDDVCIFNSDYMTARTRMGASTELKKTSEKTLEELVDTLDIYGMLVKYSQLHIFRAVEPMLTRRYIHRTCNSRNGNELFQRCERSNAEGLATRGQLAMELFPDN